MQTVLSPFCLGTVAAGRMAANKIKPVASPPPTPRRLWRAFPEEPFFYLIRPELGLNVLMVRSLQSMEPSKRRKKKEKQSQPGLLPSVVLEWITGKLDDTLTSKRQTRLSNKDHRSRRRMVKGWNCSWKKKTGFEMVCGCAYACVHNCVSLHVGTIVWAR